MAIQRSVLVTKAQELMKNEWLDYATAAKKARDLTAPPVTPPTTHPVQTTQPIPTQNFPSQPLNQQTTTGVNGETFQVAPVNAQGVTPQAPQWVAPVQPVAPNTPVPTQNVSQTTPTVTPAPDKNAEIKAQNEAQMALNKQQAEIKQAERDKQAQDANNALANNEWAILNTLKTGGIIPDSVKTSPYYKSAQQTYNKLQQFSTYSIGELTTALNNGSILPWTSVYNELLKDPAMKQKLVEAQAYTSWTPSIPQHEAVTQEIIANNPITASYLADWVITQDEWDKATNNAEVVAKAKDVEAKVNKYNQLKAEYDAIEDEVKAQFPWSPFADSIIADRQKAKYKNVLLAKGEMDTANGTLTELKSNAANLFETNLKLYQDNQAFDRLKQLAVFQANLWLKTKQAEFDQQIAQKAQAMNDPTTAISTMVEEYKKLGIPFTRSTQQVISDFQSSGQDLPTYLSNLQATIQKKPEYKQAMARQAWQGISYQTIGDKVYKQNADGSLTLTNIDPTKSPSKAPDWKQDANGNWYNASSSINPASQELLSKYPNDAGLKNNNPAGLTWGISSSLKQKFIDAGINFSQGTSRPANEGGSYISFATPEDGLKAYQIALTTGGSDDVYSRLKQWVWTSNGDTYAQQIMNASWINQSVKFSELSPEQMNSLLTNQIKRESPWFYALMNIQQENTTIGQSDIVAYNSATPTEKAKILKSKVWKQITEERNKVFSDPNASINDILSYSQWGKTINQTSEWQLYKFSQALNQVSDLQKEISNASTWPILGILRSNNPYDVKAQEIKAQLSALLPNLARWVYGEVWVLTDNDIANYSKTVPNLKSTEEVNNAILAMTLKGIANGYKSKLQSLASAGYDVSGYEWIYTNIQNTVDWILQNPVNSTTPASIPSDIYAWFEADYSNL